MKLKPQGERLLVQIVEEKETDSSFKLQLILPEVKDTYGMPKKGIVVAVGEGEHCARMDFQVGDVVYFSKWEDNRLKISPRTLAELGDTLKEDEIYIFLDPRKVYGRTYAKENESAPKKERASQGLGRSGGNADSDEDAGKSEEQQESAGTKKSELRAQRKKVEAQIA